MVDGGWRVAGDGWVMVDGGWRVTGGRRVGWWQGGGFRLTAGVVLRGYVIVIGGREVTLGIRFRS